MGEASLPVKTPGVIVCKFLIPIIGAPLRHTSSQDAI